MNQLNSIYKLLQHASEKQIKIIYAFIRQLIEGY